MPDNLRIMVRAATPDERGFSYTQPELFKESGCIGHLRADMGNTGTQFFSSWDDHQAGLKTQAFKDEFDQFINELRKNPEYSGMLRSRAALYAYCHAHPEAALGNGQEFAFRADTDKHSYMLRLNPSRGAYNAYIYAYEKEQFDRNLSGQPIEQEIPIPEEAQDTPKKSNREKLKEITDSIENGIRDVFTSGKYQQYLQTMSRFHRYSFNNTMLIFMQKPDATRVAGFNKWRDDFKRTVKRGEKGIKIIAPAISKKTVEKVKLDPDTKAPMLDENGQAIMEEKQISIPRFRVATVFDVSQTEGEPLPELAAAIKGDVKQYEAFVEALKRSSPVPVNFEDMNPDCDGVFREGKQMIAIREGMSEAQTVAALVHEITHAKLHNDVFPAENDPTEYDKADLNGLPCLFTKNQVDENTLPGGLFKYDLRSTHDHVFHSIEKKVTNHRAGSIITAKPVELSATGAHVLGEDENLVLRDGASTLKQFYEDHKKDRNTQEVEAESVAYSVCQYYGIETGENSFGYLASWSSSKEVSELKDSLTTINETASSLITDIDKNFLEVCKERGIDPKEVLGEQETGTLDTYPVLDPSMSMDSLAAFGEEGTKMLPLSRDRALEECRNDWMVYYMDGGQIVMAADAEDITSQPEGTVFAMYAQDWQIHPQFHEHLQDRLKNQEQREAAFDAYPGDCYAIYQVKRGDDQFIRDYAFRGFKELTEANLSVQRGNYDLCYTAPATEPVDPEKLYEKFNLQRPGDFGGHSLSVSDIVAIKQDGHVSYYYCDSFGFQELPDFRKPENYLKAAEMTTEDDYGMIDGIINNGQKQPTVAELEEQVKQGQSISVLDLYNAVKEESRAKKPSVLEKLKSQPPQEIKKTAPKKSAEREI